MKNLPDEEMVWLRIDRPNPTNIKFIEVDEDGNIKIAKSVLPFIYFTPVTEPLKRINISIQDKSV